jgi:hypothetical protein
MESTRSNEVFYLADYRQRGAQQKQPLPPEDPAIRRLLDEVSYHILMAARAIASQTSK